MKNKNFKNQKAFTLIELLVVIAIIGLISTIAVVALNDARSKARDTKRKADLKQIRTALELFYDSNGNYPPEAYGTDTSIGCDGTYPNASDWCAGSDLNDLVTAGYMSNIPIDPKNNSTYFYYLEPDGTGQGSPACTVNSCRFVLRARLESGGYWYNDSFGVGAR